MGVECSDKARKSCSTGMYVGSPTLQKVGSDVLDLLYLLRSILRKESMESLFIN